MSRVVACDSDCLKTLERVVLVCVQAVNATYILTNLKSNTRLCCCVVDSSIWNTFNVESRRCVGY